MAKKRKGNKKGSSPGSPVLNSWQKEIPKCTTWKQTENNVTFVIDLPKRPDTKELDTDFTDSRATVLIKGGAPWQCTFYADIKRELTVVQLQNTRVYIKVVKKVPGQTWVTLENKSSTEDSIPVKDEDKKSDSGNKEDSGTTKTNTKAGDKEAQATGVVDKDDDTDSGGNQQNTLYNDVETYDLNHVKHDWYEKSVTSVVVCIYVKSTSSVKVAFQSKNLDVKFQTNDNKFLGMHKDTNKNTTFSWSVTLMGELDVEACKFRVTTSMIELTLLKKEAKRWSSLEAKLKQPSLGLPAVKEGWTSTASSKPVTSPNQNATSSSQVEKSKAKEKATSAVKFDEMCEGTERKEVCNQEGMLAPPPLPSMHGDSKENNIQKPTCKVSPLKDKSEQVVRPGMTGLDNLGNTCFMNSVLQVLSNTRELRDYFLDSEFQKDINTDNPLGSGGKLAISYALLLRILWSGKHYSYSPSKLKNLVAQKASQFSGYAQHDAQEFMAFLLDGLHEDLNRIKKKPYTETVDSDNRPDHVVADLAWSVHKKRNDSFIVDHFQGQYKSKLTCPVCKKISITFDPFMILPVPLPKKQRLLPVTFMSKDPHGKPTRYMLRLPRDATVEALKDAISKKTGVHHRDLRAYESYKHGFHQFFNRGTSLSNVSAADSIVVSEVLSEKVAGEEVYELMIIQRVSYPQSIPTKCSYCRQECQPDAKLKRCTRCFKTAYCDRNCQASDWQQKHKTHCKLTPELIGEPFILSIPKSQATYYRLVQMLEAFSTHSVDVFQPPVVESTVPYEKTENSFTEQDADNSDGPGAGSDNGSTSSNQSDGSISDGAPDRFCDDKNDGKSDKSDDSSSPKVPTRYVMGRQRDLVFVDPPFDLKAFIDKDCRRPLDSEDQNLQDLGEEPLNLSNIHFLSMDWKNHEKCKSYVMVQSKSLEQDEDGSMRTLSLEEQREVTIHQCMDLFTEPEVLSPEESWYCPKCKEHREATKQLSIWKLPSTLIIQLKRFSFQNFIWRDKIDKMVEFPIRGLDLSRFYVGNRPINEPRPLYDLYGVINHYGGILGGHYTAYSRTPDLNNFKSDEMGWRIFDDSHVTQTSEKQVVTQSAYVLFYRRRDDQAVDVPAEINPNTAVNEMKQTIANNDEEEEEDCNPSPPPPPVMLPQPIPVKQKSGIKPTSTVTAREAKLQDKNCSETLGNDNMFCDLSYSANEVFASTVPEPDGNPPIALSSKPVEGTEYIDNIHTGILPINIDSKGLNSENSSDFTDMDTVD